MTFPDELPGKIFTDTAEVRKTILELTEKVCGPT